MVFTGSELLSSFFLIAQPCLTKPVELRTIMSWFLCYIWGSRNNKTLKKVFLISFQESRESQVSSAAASDNQAPLFSDRTDETDKTLTRYQLNKYFYKYMCFFFSFLEKIWQGISIPLIFSQQEEIALL